jgi:hypothetical protein
MKLIDSAKYREMAKNRNWRGFVNDVIVLITGVIVGAVFWSGGQFVKSYLSGMHSGKYNAWAYAFFNPDGAALINYFFSCAGIGIYGAVLYFAPQRISKRREGVNQSGLMSLCIAAGVMLYFLLRVYFKNHRYYGEFLALVVCSPALYFLLLRSAGLRIANIMCFVLIGAFFLFLCVEPARVMTEPVYLLNEYGSLHEKTLVGNEYVANEDYLRRMSGDEATRKNPDLYANFIEANRLEYGFQITTRGQLNHASHIYNPINEYAGGKRLSEVYAQYGAGNALLQKWIMDISGGLSIQNYYKIYVFYLLYLSLFLTLLFFLFKDNIYVLNGMLVYAVAFFSYGYNAYILAPGIIPSVHFFDVIVIVFFSLYLERKWWMYLFFAALVAGASVFLNSQFGSMLVVALGLSSLFYAAENIDIKKRTYVAVTGLLAFFAIGGVWKFSSANNTSTFSYFLNGFLSVRPKSLIIELTLFYLALSWLFLARLKTEKAALKYVYAFVFIYTQELLVYFFWSGYLSHLQMAIPFLGMQVLLMVYIYHQKVADSSRRPGASIRAILVISAFILLLMSVMGIEMFYREKSAFRDVFSQHKMYQWDFDRARIISTVDPTPFQQSISLIHKYSPEMNSGIFIISEYDNLLPFLSHRHSLMPFFDMAWYLVSPQENETAVSVLKLKKPEYLFVDAAMLDVGNDPWRGIYCDSWQVRERESYFGRREELKNVFLAVSADYEKLESGELLSVYRRRIF